ncbi:MAG: Rpn family recombination-promoting nuclease/putative transposase [Gammaproteobacteria bacterium]
MAMVDHDHSYKLLFSHPEMVRDLLEGFVCGEWIARLDLGTLERVSGAYVDDDLRARASDIVWRARCGERYVYISIEFQSTVEQAMALRVFSYVILLYQELHREKKDCPDGRLPVVVPIVLYNGERRWSAPDNLGSLLGESPEGTEEYRPQLRYLLIDEGRYDDRELAASRNLVAMLFRLEHGCRRDQIRDVASALMRQLESAGLVSLRRAFGVWLDRVFRARLARGRGEEVDELWEKRSMLADRVDEWAAELRQEGLQEGRQEGHQAGEVTLMTRLLHKRFGQVPTSILARLGGAHAAQIERWGERLFEASTLSEIFDGE